MSRQACTYKCISWYAQWLYTFSTLPNFQTLESLSCKHWQHLLTLCHASTETASNSTLWETILVFHWDSICCSQTTPQASTATVIFISWIMLQCSIQMHAHYLPLLLRLWTSLNVSNLALVTTTRLRAPVSCLHLQGWRQGFLLPRWPPSRCC